MEGFQECGYGRWFRYLNPEQTEVQIKITHVAMREQENAYQLKEALLLIAKFEHDLYFIDDYPFFEYDNTIQNLIFEVLDTLKLIIRSNQGHQLPIKMKWFADKYLNEPFVFKIRVAKPDYKTIARQILIGERSAITITDLNLIEEISKQLREMNIDVEFVSEWSDLSISRNDHYNKI